jgi:hypothetical protein
VLSTFGVPSAYSFHFGTGFPNEFKLRVVLSMLSLTKKHLESSMIAWLATTESHQLAALEKFGKNSQMPLDKISFSLPLLRTQLGKN